MLIVHLFVSYAHANLCHFFSSSWYQGLAATSACGSSWTFLFIFLQRLSSLSRSQIPEDMFSHDVAHFTNLNSVKIFLCGATLGMSGHDGISLSDNPYSWNLWQEYPGTSGHHSTHLSNQKHIVKTVTGRFAHFPVRPESFRPESFRPRVVSPSITWVVLPSYPESFRPPFDESFRPLSKFIFYWGYCDKFTIFVSFNEDFGYISLKTDMSFISWSKWCIYLYSV